MASRYNIVQIKRVHESLLETNRMQLITEDSRAIKMLADQKSKTILDNFIMLKINESQIENPNQSHLRKSFMEEVPDRQDKKKKRSEFRSKNLKLISNQLACKNWLN